MFKKILLSFLSGLVILFITWTYQNYDFSFSAEDGFFKKLSFLKYKIFPADPKYYKEIIFINTGKDIAVVEDTLDYGSVAISDREKIYRLVRHLGATAYKPEFTVLDIQFYYPYTIKPGIDTLLADELAKNDRIMIPVVKDRNGAYKPPLYKSLYAYSDYQTFGSFFNKFRILNHGEMRSIPVILQEKTDKQVYEDHLLYTTCNGHLCLSAIWPRYYLTNDSLKNTSNIGSPAAGMSSTLKTSGNLRFTEYYNLGELLIALEADPASYARFFENKLLFVGNFEEDVHSTPLGKMSGPVLLANIYLSLLNGQHFVSYALLVIILVVFSGLSYVAWFSKMPEIKLNFKFLFSSYLIKFIRGYISYFGCMFVLSLLAIFFFNIQLALFLPSFIFAGIEYVRQKKYRSDKPSL